MNRTAYFKEKIKKLFEESPDVHMNVSLTKPRIELHGAEARIVGVYEHLFRIEERTGGLTKYHSIQYTELISGNVEILELENK